MHVNRPRSFVFQNPDHQVVMPTVEADVAFGLGKFSLTLNEVRSRVSKALDAVGMLEYSQRPIQTLSGGQKQRVAIAGALAEACKVLLLDELTTFLDENDQGQKVLEPKTSGKRIHVQSNQMSERRGFFVGSSRIAVIL
uniref:ABC transporter I family member 10 isoform X2 n=2 Tax=Elaeis guineensis var. tenera TaxID=51953 RepID=A0A8N4F4K3_ELAGV|nr:ABC transporter I family member 10 isoform X2 [Elaeis guineensis]